MAPILATRGAGSALGFGRLSAVNLAQPSFESIATVSLSTTSTSISFTSIPGTYTHLQLRGIARTFRGANEEADTLNLRFNSNSSAIYTRHRMIGTIENSTGVAASIDQAQTYLERATADTGAAANSFGAFITDIADYANTNKFKTLKTIGGNRGGSLSSLIVFSSGLWRSTSAITSIQITPNSGTYFQTYTTFALYGIKTA